MWKICAELFLDRFFSKAKALAYEIPVFVRFCNFAYVNKYLSKLTLTAYWYRYRTGFRFRSGNGTGTGLQ
jgi:hypothetical protein